MKKILILLFVISIFFYSCKILNLEKSNKKILVITYNVENLFDTINNPHTRDDEFTPDGKKHWNTKRYRKKLKNIANILSNISKRQMPGIIALEEVENNRVLDDLIQTGILKKNHYKYIHKEMSDPRGIDQALIYNPQVFKPIEVHKIPVFYYKNQKHSTREILYVKGLIDGDTLYLFVNHWKSRYGGLKKTEFKRIIYAKILRQKIDSIFSKNSNADILCLGDFNDTPDNISIKKYLNASEDSIFQSPAELFNLCAYAAKKGKGTINYHDKWYMIDNIIISQHMMHKKSKLHCMNTAKIYKSKLNSRFNPKANDTIPYKTYGGNTYFGGVSDHFPIYIYIEER
jgi:predicted extracellular nuclease